MLRSIKNIDVKGKRVLLRVDFNVPIKNGKVMDDTRIRGSLPTIRHLLFNGARLIICSHLGRPKGQIIPEMSLRPVAAYLEKVLKKEVEFITDYSSFMLNDYWEIVLLENLRFNPGEAKNDPELAETLASMADIYVSDAFGTVHRVHASTVGVTSFLPSYAGFLVEEEYNRITKAVDSPVSPSIVVIGGAKVSTKLDIIQHFINIFDTIIIGGGMAYTFLKNKGYEIGQSLCEENMLEVAGEIMNKARSLSKELILPVDMRVAYGLDVPDLVGDNARIVAVDSMPSDRMALDIGPESERLFSSLISRAETIIWNGPMGVFEQELYRSGTNAIAHEVAMRDVPTIIGGGDTAYAIKLSGENLPDNIHVSTGGGASLELLAGKKLPGIECLED